MNPTKLLRSSTARLGLVYVALFALSVLVLTGIVYWLASTFVARLADEAVDSEIERFVSLYERRGLPGLLGAVAERGAADPTGRMIYLVADPLRRPIIGNFAAWPAEAATGDEERFAIEVERGDDGGKVLFRGRSVVLAGDLSLLVARNTEDAVVFRRELIAALAWSVVPMLALGIAGGLLMSTSTVRRIETINKTMRDIMAGDLGLRVTTRGTGDDFDRLAENLNAMLDRIGTLIDGVRRVSDGVAHDLRTPLTRLRGRLERIERREGASAEARAEIEAAIAEADTIIATFNALLRIARIESGSQAIARTRFDLATMIDDVLDLYEPVCEEKGVVLHRPASGPCACNADRDLMFQAVANLVDNAVKYASAGGEVRVAVERAGDRVRIAIADDGPGIPAESRAKAFERFVRFDARVPGTGLGLALVAAIVRLHEGTVALADNGPGLRATIEVPA